MIYRVVLSQQAAAELDATADWWSEHRSEEQAGRWYEGFSDAIWALREFPERNPVAAEDDEFPYEIRELHYGLSSRPTHRAVYTIIADNVLILTIRHAAQDRISPEDTDFRLSGRVGREDRRHETA